jgi:anti-sigma-K factor RskA
MSHPEQESPRDLAAAYALGALEPEESREFEAFLATSAEAQRDVAEYRDVAALLGLGQAGEGPARALRARVLAHVGGQSADVNRSGGWPSRLGWVALAAGLILVLGLGAAVLSLRRDVHQRDAVIAQRDSALALRQQELTARQALLDAVLDPEVRLFQLTSSGDPEPGIQLFWNQRRNQALLNAYRLKPVPAGRAYQLWFIREGKPVPSVTFTPTSDGTATIERVTVPSEGKISAAAITIEPIGGSAQPTSPIVLLGPLQKS